MAARRSCPSCKHRLSPFAAECPVCGLAVERKAPPRPLLFQATALQAGSGPGRRASAIATPALGRIVPVAVTDLPPAEAPRNLLLTLPRADLERFAPPEASSFWLMARLEAGEALLLAVLNGFLVLLGALLLRVDPGRSAAALWPYLLPFHLAASWAALMVPLVLIGQSPLMLVLGLRLAAEQPERRMAFSLFHLLSVALFPLSFLCMVLTPNHRSLAELLTGLEVQSSPGVRSAEATPAGAHGPR